MSTPRRRPTSGIRRPQVAGRRRTGRAGDEEEHEERADTGGVALDERAGADAAGPATRGDDPAAGTGDGPDPAHADGADPDAATDHTDDADGADERVEVSPASPVRARSTGAQDGGARRRFPLPPAPSGRAATAALLAVTVLLAAAAVFFGVSWYRTTFAGSAANTALSDVGTTAQISEQVGEAVTKVYSFDYARLDQAEADARAMITPAFQAEFDRIFGSVRQLAPQQKAVVTATIPKSAVASIRGDDATVYVFVNQVIRRQADGGAPQEGSAAARLRVDAEFVDGRWKIAAMTPA